MPTRLTQINLAPQLKQEYNVGYTAIDCVCKLLHSCFLPTGNLFPPSNYLIQKIADVECIDDVEYHMCECLDYIYPQIKRKDWKLHTGDTCLKCGTPRFDVRRIGGNVVRTPKKVSYVTLC